LSGGAAWHLYVAVCALLGSSALSWTWLQSHGGSALALGSPRAVVVCAPALPLQRLVNSFSATLPQDFCLLLTRTRGCPSPGPQRGHEAAHHPSPAEDTRLPITPALLRTRGCPSPWPWQGHEAAHRPSPAEDTRLPVTPAPARRRLERSILWDLPGHP